MGAEPVEPGLMTRPPRPPDQSVLGDGLWQRVLAVSSVLAVATLGIGLWSNETGRAWQTIIFLGLISLQLGVALGLRPRQLSTQNPMLLGAVAGSFALAIAGVYLPIFQTFLGTDSLPLSDLLLATALGVVGWIAVQLTRRRRSQP